MRNIICNVAVDTQCTQTITSQWEQQLPAGSDVPIMLLHCAQWHQLVEWKRQLQWQSTEMFKHWTHPMLRKHQLFLPLMWRRLTSKCHLVCSISLVPWSCDLQLQTPRELTSAYSRFFLSPTLQCSTKVICWVFITSFSGFVPEVSSCCRAFDIVLSKTDSNGVRIPTTQIRYFSSLARGLPSKPTVVVRFAFCVGFHSAISSPPSSTSVPSSCSFTQPPHIGLHKAPSHHSQSRSACQERMPSPSNCHFLIYY